MPELRGYGYPGNVLRGCHACNGDSSTLSLKGARLWLEKCDVGMGAPKVKKKIKIPRVNKEVQRKRLVSHSCSLSRFLLVYSFYAFLGYCTILETKASPT